MKTRWLVHGAKAGDSLFMHYSGHGGSVKDNTGDEEDNKDETMIPVDYMKSGQIKDDEILKEVCACLPCTRGAPPQSRFTAVHAFSQIPPQRSPVESQIGSQINLLETLTFSTIHH